MSDGACKFCGQHLEIGSVDCLACGCVTPERTIKDEDVNSEFTDYSYNRYDDSFLARVYGRWLSLTAGLFVGHGFWNRVGSFLFTPLIGGKPALRYSDRETFIDVGCGRGFFLRNLPKTWIVEGCDIVSYPDKPENIIVGNFEKIDFKRKYSIVRSSHSLEHATNPKAFLDRLVDIADNQGVIVISSPNAQSWSYRIFKRFWLPFNVASHFCILDMSAVSGYLQQKGCKILYKGTYTLFSSAGSLVELLGIKRFPGFFFAAFVVVLLPLTILEFAFNRSDSFIVYAKKI